MADSFSAACDGNSTAPAGPDGAPYFWRRRHTIVGLCACSIFLCYIDRVNMSVAALAMQRDLHWSETTKGWIMSAFFLGYMMLHVPTGWLANRFGGKRVMTSALVLWSIFTMLTPIAAMLSVPALICARLALGAGESASYPSIYNLVSRWVPTGERGRSLALISGSSPAGTLFALSVTGWIVSRWSWHAAFYVFGAMGLVLALFWLLLAHDSPIADRRVTAAELAEIGPGAAMPRVSIPWKMLFTTPAIYAIMINQFCSNWAYYMLLAWLPSYFAGRLNISTGQAGLYSAAPWLTMFVAGLVVGVICDRLVRNGVRLIAIRKVAQTASLLGTAVCLLLAGQMASAMGVLAMMCCAVGFLAFTLIGYIPNFFDVAPRQADVLVGIANVTGTLPGVIGVGVTGWLVDRTGSYNSAFVLTAVLSIIGAVVWLVFAKAEPIDDQGQVA